MLITKNMFGVIDPDIGVGLLNGMCTDGRNSGVRYAEMCYMFRNDIAVVQYRKQE